MPQSASFDLLVIGGGINGAGIARDAVGRGMKVLLVEQGDLAGATSSASSKLAHGGLRYLESYEFRLVAEALAERETLLRIAPHLIRPLTFVLPHTPRLRPAWMIRIGLFLYDHLARRSRLPASRTIRLSRDLPGHPLASIYERAFTYADCWLDDSRLVVLNVVDARERGADVRTRTRFVDARPAGGVWQVRLAPEEGPADAVTARAIVNAAGPWADAVLGSIYRSTEKRLRLVRGSHIVVPRVTARPEAYILQNDDRRVVFVLPFEERFTLIGTTDVEQADVTAIEPTPAEVEYLCAAASRYLARTVTPADVVRYYAGVRALYDNRVADPSKVTREYELDLRRSGPDSPPVLTVYGGKLTTYRRLAERALDKLAPVLGTSTQSWTSTAPLPGGDIPGGDLDDYQAALQARWPWLDPALARRLVRAYGTRAEGIAGSMGGTAGQALVGGITPAELSYLTETELARTVDDVLWRRSKLGLTATPEEVANLERSLSALRRNVPAA